MEKKTLIALLCIFAVAITVFVTGIFLFRHFLDDSSPKSVSELDENENKEDEKNEGVSDNSRIPDTSSFSFDMENLNTYDAQKEDTNISASGSEDGLDAIEYESLENDSASGADSYVDISSWGTTGVTPKSGGNPMAGFRLAGTYYACDSSYGDGQPWIKLGSDGYVQYHMNEGSGIYDLKGWYTYDETVEYTDQGADIKVNLYFYDVSDNYAKAELVYEPLEGYFIWLSDGFGLMGGDDYFAGYFYP